ncbi:putative ribosome biogenesis GTPase RsgA 2 [Candidatus Vecturithrix granuli]|uniref:Small ribosomal subunit biogenesis GTPase RsgA n=1 Tax=Vecturithrix granuli TaxID=1499967 RepID=A0A081C970_VECG1|nr:putative ribosome biogenesis GTPase RsgA 2 [Candidatus Vecturithrix granuli]
MNLAQFGWNPFFEAHFSEYSAAGFMPARICSEHKQQYQVYTESGEYPAEVSGKMLYLADSRSDFPAVGDWVAVNSPENGGLAIIHAILPRKSCFSRKMASGRDRRSGGRPEEQVLAANVDTVFLVSGLDREFNLRRIERYLTLVYNSGATPVIVLNKADVCDDWEYCVAEVKAIAFDAPIHPISAKTQNGLDALRNYLQPGKTAALLGSSGVGKSTIMNALLGYERQRVQVVSAQVGKGQHTTTERELIPVPTGGLLIDTPGMRELQLWSSEENLKGSFEDIETLAVRCRFADCQHESEPGCAVRAAVETGELDASRLQSYRKLTQEVAYLEQRQDSSADYLERKKWKQIAKWQREYSRISLKR